MVDLRPRWTMGYPGYGRQSDTMVDPRPRWAMGQWPIDNRESAYTKKFCTKICPLSEEKVLKLLKLKHKCIDSLFW